VNPDGSVDPFQLEGVNQDLRVWPFFHHGGTISIREFVVGALNAEMGLEVFDPDLAQASAGTRVVTPAGMVLDGMTDTVEAPPATSASDDPDLDGVANEIPVSLVDHMEFYLLNYFKPGMGRQTHDTEKGRKIFDEIQCTGCHIQNLVIEQDRRVADVKTTYDRRRGIFIDLFAVATPLFQEVPGSGSPSVKSPKGQRFIVKNNYGDFSRIIQNLWFWPDNLTRCIGNPSRGLPANASRARPPLSCPRAVRCGRVSPRQARPLRLGSGQAFCSGKRAQNH